VSAATYAVTLAGVAGLQAADDRARIEAQQPSVDALAVLTSHNDDLATRLDRSATVYDALAAGYDPLVGNLATLETRIDELSGTVAAIVRSSANLPSRAPIGTSVRAAPKSSRPTSHATTGASGGG
jgi:hypothetical protein